MSDLSNRIVQKLWSYCNVLRDDGLIFRKAQNKIQDPAKLRQLIVELIGKYFTPRPLIAAIVDCLR